MRASRSVSSSLRLPGGRPVVPAPALRADESHQAIKAVTVAADGEPGQFAAENGRVFLLKRDRLLSKPGPLLSKQVGELLADLGPDILMQQVTKATSIELRREAPELAREVRVGLDQPYAAVQLGHTDPRAVEE